MSAPAAMAEDALEIHPGTPNVYFVTNMVKGEEVDPIFDSAKYVVEEDFYVGRQPHLPIEPDVGFAYFVRMESLIFTLRACPPLPCCYDCRRNWHASRQHCYYPNQCRWNFGYKFSPTIEAPTGSCRYGN